MSGILPKYHTPAAIRILTPGLLWRVDTELKEVYLTFDDGPHPQITPWVLELLSKYEAKATFFCVGDNIRKHPDTFKQIKTAGHTIANHTYNHLDIFKNERAAYLENVALCEALTGTKLFRPPYGKITLPLFFDLKKLGYTIVMWDLLSRDFESELDCDESISSMEARITEGCIPLFHDSEKAFTNLQIVLPQFLECIYSKGFVSKALIPPAIAIFE